MRTIEETNYRNDPRTQAHPEGIPTTIIEVEIDGELWEEERELPWKWDVCSTCDGKGTHVNPSIDANGLTADDFADDPDFAEDYWSGRYDQVCNECKGRTTVQVVDETRCSHDLLEAYYADQQALREEAYRDRYDY